MFRWIQKILPTTPLSSIASLLNLCVLLGSIAILVILSLEILYPAQYTDNSLFLKIRFAVSITFLLDIVVRFFKSESKWRYILRNLLFFLISIPYINCFHLLQIPLTSTLNYFLHAMLLLRGAYGLVVVVSWVTTSKLANLLISYLLILVASTYFSSLLFYEVESTLNSQVVSYWDALYWASMNVTTVGSSLAPVTYVGKLLSVTLGALGMCLFPIVTAFITNKFQKRGWFD